LGCPRRSGFGSVVVMPQREAIDWASVDAAATDRVISRAELVQLGVSERMVSARCRPSGSWTRLLPGIVMLHTGTPTWRQRIAAAVRYAGPSAVLTGIVGAWLLGLRRLPAIEEIHVLVPADRRRQSQRGLTIERTTRLPKPTYHVGFPVAPTSRTLIDGVRRIPDVDQIRAFLSEAVQRQAVTPADLQAELDAGSGRGTAIPRMVLQELTDGVWSPAESWARRIALRSRLPAPLWNVGLSSETGAFLGIPDAWFDDVALAWEIDSYEFHLSLQSYARALAKHARFTAAGIVVVHILPSRLRAEPTVVRAELEASYEQAARRPRPSVVAAERQRQVG
jgi:hypothetical protein